MNRRELKNSLKRAVVMTAPEVFEQGVAPEQTKEKRVMQTQKNNVRAFPKMVVAASLLFVLGCSLLASTLVPRVDSIISMDVNPSIQIATRSNDKVLSVTAMNEDALRVLDGMDLKNVDLDVATNAILGALLKNGYLSAENPDNTVLISVANKNQAKAEKLEKEMGETVSGVLKENNTQATVLTQKESVSKEMKALAEQYGISVGKADFVLKLMSKDATLNAEELAKMSMKDLAALISAKKIPLTDLVSAVDLDDDDDLSDAIEDAIDDKNDAIEDASEEEEDRIADSDDDDDRDDRDDSDDDDDKLPAATPAPASSSGSKPAPIVVQEQQPAASRSHSAASQQQSHERDDEKDEKDEKDDD